jgi:hypothetical protein
MNLTLEPFQLGLRTVVVTSEEVGPSRPMFRQALALLAFQPPRRLLADHAGLVAVEAAGGGDPTLIVLPRLYSGRLKKHCTDHQHHIANDREPETSSDRVVPRDGIGREPSREGPVADGHVDREDQSSNSRPKSQAAPWSSSQPSQYQRS